MPTLSIEVPSDVYVSTDGSVRINLTDLPGTTWFNAFTRVADHAFGNEAIAKGSAAKDKTPGMQTNDAAYMEIVTAARNKMLADMLAGQWGHKGRRTPKATSGNELEDIYLSLRMQETRMAMKKSNYAAGAKPDTWVHPRQGEVPLEKWAEAYVRGRDDRETSLRDRAQKELDTRIARREAAALRTPEAANGGDADELTI